MDFTPFWTILTFSLAAFGYWKCLVLLALWNIVCYFIWEYEPRAPPNNFRVCIVGAGFSGIGTAIKLKKLDIDYEMYEAAPEIGGTWYANTYPGCACDIQAHLYSYSFEPNPDWTRKFVGHKEILRYLKDVVKRNHVRVRYNSAVKSIRWDKASKEYTVTLETGHVDKFNAVVFGAGTLREPVTPDFKGRVDFEGESFHSATWNNNCDLTGKRVAVIGTGASAVQIVPSICKKVDQLYVFQRTPCWTLPRFDGPVSSYMKMVFNYVPGVMYVYRMFLFSLHELWYVLMFRKESAALPYLRRMLAWYIRGAVNDKLIAEKMVPNFNPGCKRVTPSDTYLQSFNRENVHLLTDGIDRITTEGIMTADGREVKVDVIVYATGYSPLKSFRDAFEVVNGDGVTLNDVVGDNPSAYLGITVPNFPNFFILLGQHTVLGHNTVVWMIECQINYVGDCLRRMLQEKVRSMHPKESSHRNFVSLVERFMKNKVFSGGSGCVAWYTNDRGINYTLWPSNLPHYWQITRAAHLDDYVTEK